MRPVTPEKPIPYPDPSRVPFNIEPQKDEETGAPISPAYKVPKNPSIIYTPPGGNILSPLIRSE